MTAMGIVTVLLVHSVVAGELPEGTAVKSPLGLDTALSRPVEVAQGWRYPPYGYRWRPAPRYVLVYPDYDRSPRYSSGEPPWRPVSLSLSAGFAYCAGADVAVGGPGAAFGVRLGAGLVDRLSLTVALEGTGSRREGQDESEAAALLGLQWYPLPFLYFRGAFGAGVVSLAGPGGNSDYAGSASGVVHPALSAAIGLEIADSAGFAFGLEGASTWIYVPGENWNAVQISMVVSFF
jgi:hypothetical protein